MRGDIVKVSGTSPDQRAAWRACAAAAGLPMAAWVREAADAAAATGTTAADLRDALVWLRTDLGRGLGNNVNQLAHALNLDLKAGHRPEAAAHERALAAAAADAAAMRRAVDRALRGLGQRPRPRRAAK